MEKINDSRLKRNIINLGISIAIVLAAKGISISPRQVDNQSAVKLPSATTDLGNANAVPTFTPNEDMYLRNKRMPANIDVLITGGLHR